MIKSHSNSPIVQRQALDRSLQRELTGDRRQRTSLKRDLWTFTLVEVRGEIERKVQGMYGLSQKHVSFHIQGRFRRTKKSWVNIWRGSHGLTYPDKKAFFFFDHGSEPEESQALA